MPIYEYECLQCGKRTELLQRLGEAPLAACPQCGGQVRKLISAPAVQFKGSGWYATDYASKKGAAPDKAEGASEGKSESKSESKPESKSESSSSESKSAPAKSSD
jgi:putative FmdB family regulatory protein